MKVYKFGGASIETTERARNVVSIINDFATEKLLIVISAKGKTTNALEKVVEAFFRKENELALKLLKDIEEDHFNYASELLGTSEPSLVSKLQELFTEIHWVLEEPEGRGYDYYYDQIVSVGELLSTSIIAAYMNLQGLPTEWVDIRDVMKTDNTYRDATIEWDLTQKLASDTFLPKWNKCNIILSQGFIGSTDENNSVTLGREGSDYTAAVMANMLNAESVTIWKDVPSLLNADPKIFPNTVPIEEITFREVIEMAYYGAQVIHPKTIKPLQNKDIPLYVKCFLDKNLQGTLIHNSEKSIEYPPIMVLKTNQVLLQVTTKDYSFITEDNLSRIYTLFHDCKVKINLICDGETLI
jgi:aspartate kinase